MKQSFLIFIYFYFKKNAITREIVSIDVHTRFLGTGVRVDVGYRDLRRTTNFGDVDEYMLDEPLLPDVSLTHRHEVRLNIDGNYQNQTIQTVRRRFWDKNNGNVNFYKLLPGDDVLVKCAYSTREAIRPIFGGMNSEEEVCFAFITYVTKQHRESHWAGEEDKNEPLKHDFKCNKRIRSDITNSE